MGADVPDLRELFELGPVLLVDLDLLLKLLGLDGLVQSSLGVLPNLLDLLQIYLCRVVVTGLLSDSSVMIQLIEGNDMSIEAGLSLIHI